jgi:anti-sigma factor RsiW
VTCRDVLHLVEAIAAGDLEVDDEVRAHFESCPRCASELASARRLEILLAARTAPQPPARFSSMVLGSIRNDRWQSEQRVDRIFNVAIGVAVLLIVGGLAALTNVSGVLMGATWLWDNAAEISARLMDRALPAVVTYVAAAGLLMSALGMWWWAERRLML